MPAKARPRAAVPAFPFTFRQVHLDYHTSEAIGGVGDRFDKTRFQAALRLGHVSSVTLFSKCHHGWSYHPTKAGAMHPHLKFDLLAAQIEACRELGVHCPIYLSAGVDERLANLHPEWRVIGRDGKLHDPLNNQFWFKLLRFNSAYLDVLCAQIEEVVSRWPDNDGIFLDIIAPHRDYHPDTLRQMRAAGLDPASESDHDLHAQRVLRAYHERTTAACRIIRPDTRVFHNAGHVPVGCRAYQDFNSHYELESLPTGGWGYDHFPLSARHALGRGKEFLGMTGKFHTSWGEFGGFKRPEALRYECSALLAQGARCSVGDQLHPSGAMNEATYRLIGSAYAEVEAKEPWATGVRSAARIALVSADRDQPAFRGAHTASLADEGASRMLLEWHQPFTVLDEHDDWRGHALAILPEGYRMTPERLKKARAFLLSGGKILAVGDALLAPTVPGRPERFALEPDAVLLGRDSANPDYLVATPLSAADVPVETEIVIAGGCWEARPARGARVLAARRRPYFNRTWEHFCSHQHAPDAPGAATPAALLNAAGNLAWFGHDLFTAYKALGQPLHRDFFLAALHALLGALPVVTSLPRGGRLNLLEQPAERRYVAHLLYAPKSLVGSFQGKPIEIVEDLVPLQAVEIELALPRRIHSVTLEPEGEALPFIQDKGSRRARFTVPTFTCHQMVALAY